MVDSQQVKTDCTNITLHYTKLHARRTRGAVIAKDCDLDMLDGISMIGHWMEDRPLIQRYLDPTYIFVETVAGGTVPASIDAAIQTLPNNKRPDKMNGLSGTTFEGVYVTPVEKYGYMGIGAIRATHGDDQGRWLLLLQELHQWPTITHSTDWPVPPHTSPHARMWRNTDDRREYISSVHGQFLLFLRVICGRYEICSVDRMEIMFFPVHVRSSSEENIAATVF